MKNKTVACTAALVFLLALSALSVFVSSRMMMSATSHLDDSNRDGTTVDRELVPIDIHREVIRYWIHEDPGSNKVEVEDAAGGIGSCILDID